MTVLASIPQWPQGDQGKVLLHLLVNGNVDALFEDLFGSYPELQAKLHRQRNDTNCAETPWVSQRADLPGQQFVWPAPPAGADAGTPGQGKCRKVRFEAAASMASKAFSSEEIQLIQVYCPGSHYLVQAEVYTTAMYGDQFCIISRTSLVARGCDKTQLHIVYAIDFKPTISRLLKPMVAKGVDGGIRGTFGLLKKLLQEQYTLRDLPDTAPGPEMPGAAAPAVTVPIAPTPAAAPEAVPAAAAAASSPALLQLADYIVYQELVAGILQMSDPGVIAKGFALCMMLALLHAIITMLRPIVQACSAASSSGGFMSLLCWPLVGVLDLPDNLTEVLSAMLLVAAANKLLMLGTKMVAAWTRAPAAARAFSGLRLGMSLQNIGVPTPAAAAAEVAASGTSEGLAISRSSRAAAAKHGTVSSQLAPSPIPAEGIASAAGSPVPASGTPATPLDQVFNNLGNVVSGWGKNLLGGNALDSLFTGASWSRPSSSAATAAEVDGADAADISGQGPGNGAANGITSPAGSMAGSSSTPVGRAMSHRHTTSFTATMDPSGLNIIEDYAPEPEQMQQPLPRLAEEQQQQQQQQQEQQQRPGTPSSTPAKQIVKQSSAAELAAAGSPPARPASRSEAVAAAGGDTSVANSRSASLTKVADKKAGMKDGTSRLAFTQAAAGISTFAGASAAGSAGQQQAGKPVKSDGCEVLAADFDGEGTSRQGSLRQPLLAAASQSSSDGSIDGTRGVSKQGDSTAVAAASTSAPLMQSGSATDRATAHPKATTKAVAFSASTNSKERSPSRLDNAAGSFSVGSAGSTGSTDKPLARRSASPALWGHDGGKESVGPGSRPVSRSSVRREGLGDGLSYEALSGGAGYVVPGEEEEDEVLVEVFEHERVQPFRGWGHTWPGHFLPSDKVGHWGDRAGAPGGAMSMLFDRVAPKLPVGWAWKDEEWSVDMTGADQEGCDVAGWSYGMDFAWLTWPPGPQTGKAGLKSFVRRRRWVRTRMRLPAGSYDVDSPELQQQLAAFQQQQQEMGRSSGGGSGTGEGGLMSGLGAGAGGLFSQDNKAAAQAAAAQAAAAATQAASAMMNRFMRAVAELPTQGSGGSLPTSPPAGAQAASLGRVDSARNVPFAVAAGGAAASQQVPLSPSSRPVAVRAVSMPSPEPDEAAAAAAAAQSSIGEDDSSSSSVDSDTPPPRPRLAPASGEDGAAGHAPSPVRQLQRQLEQEAAASASAGTVDTTQQQQQQPSSALKEQEPTAMRISQGSLQASSAAVPAINTRTAEPSPAATGTTVEPLAGLHPATVTGSGDWEWSVTKVGSPTAAAAAAEGVSSSSRCADSETAAVSALATTAPGASPSPSSVVPAAAPAAAIAVPAAPVGTPISTLKKAGSGISGTSSPRVVGAGRGAGRGTRSSSGGGSRSGRGKLGAVSLRHSAEGALRTSSDGGPAWGSGVLLSPAASQGIGLTPTTSLGSGAGFVAEARNGNCADIAGSTSSMDVNNMAPATVSTRGAATVSSGSSSASSRLAASSAAAAEPSSSDPAAVVTKDSTGMSEGMYGSLCPLHVMVGSADAATSTTGLPILLQGGQLAASPAAGTAGTLATPTTVHQGKPGMLSDIAAHKATGLTDICSSPKAPVGAAAAAVAAVGSGESSASAVELVDVGPGLGSAGIADSSAGIFHSFPMLQPDAAGAASSGAGTLAQEVPVSIGTDREDIAGTAAAAAHQPAAEVDSAVHRIPSTAESATGEGDLSSSAATGEELSAGLDAADITATGISLDSSLDSSVAAPAPASTMLQEAGATSLTVGHDGAPQDSSTADAVAQLAGTGDGTGLGTSEAVGEAAASAQASSTTSGDKVTASSAHGGGGGAMERTADAAQVDAGGTHATCAPDEGGHGVAVSTAERDAAVAAAAAAEALQVGVIGSKQLRGE